MPVDELMLVLPLDCLSSSFRLQRSETDLAERRSDLTGHRFVLLSFFMTDDCGAGRRHS